MSFLSALAGLGLVLYLSVVDDSHMNRSTRLWTCVNESTTKVGLPQPNNNNKNIHNNARVLLVNLVSTGLVLSLNPAHKKT